MKTLIVNNLKVVLILLFNWKSFVTNDIPNINAKMKNPTLLAETKLTILFISCVCGLFSNVSKAINTSDATNEYVIARKSFKLFLKKLLSLPEPIVTEPSVLWLSWSENVSFFALILKSL